MVSLTDNERIAWIGVGVSKRVESTAAAARINRHAEISVGETACADLCRSADVVVLWPNLQAADLPDGKPAVWVSHVGPESQYGVNLARAGKPKVTKCVAVSRDAVHSYHAAQWGEVSVIDNAVNMDRVRPTLSCRSFRARHKLETTGKVVGYLGRLSPEKGYHAFCRAARHLPESWIMAVAGPAYHGNAIPPGEVGARIVVLGEVEDTGSFLASIDALVVPSHYESFGYSLVEGMAAGVPVICTCVGVAREHPDLVRFIPSPASPQALAMAVIEDLTQPDITGHRVQRAQQLIQKLYSAEKFGEAWTALLVEQARTEHIIHPPKPPLNDLTPTP